MRNDRGVSFRVRSREGHQSDRSTMGVAFLVCLMVCLSCYKVKSFAIDSSPKYGRLSRSICVLSSSLADDNIDGSLLDMLLPPTDCKVEQMSPTDLAFIGDALYELLVRSRSVWPPKKTSNLQTLVVGLVRGTTVCIFTMPYFIACPDSHFTISRTSVPLTYQVAPKLRVDSC